MAKREFRVSPTPTVHHMTQRAVARRFNAATAHNWFLIVEVWKRPPMRLLKPIVKVVLRKAA